MEALIIQETEFTPFISLDPAKREFKIIGVSRPEDVGNFYSSSLDWLRKFEKENSESPVIKPIRVEFFLSYFNSSSAKIILQMLEVLKSMMDSGFEISIYWYYDEGDEQVKEDGEELSSVLDLPFIFEPR
jgi:hypothetical protein